jgi:hypothetical protein
MGSSYREAEGVLKSLSMAEQLKYRIEAIKILRDLENNAHSVSARRDLGILKGQLALNKNIQDFKAKLVETKGRNLRQVLQSATELEKQAVKSKADYALKYAAQYDQVVQEAENRRRTSGLATGLTGNRGQFATVMGPLHTRLTAPGMRFDRNDPKFLKTYRAVVDVADPQGEYIKFDTDGKAILTQAGAQLTGIQPVRYDDPTTGEAVTVTGQAIIDRMNEYNERQELFVRQTADGEAELQKANSFKEQAESLLNKGNDTAAREAVEQYKESMEKYFLLTKQQYNIGDMEEVQSQIGESMARSRAYQEALKMLGPGMPKGADMNKRAQMIGDPEFQAWAEDHGFESLGEAKKRPDGTWQYTPGGDDIAAMRLYYRQSKRQKFNYGPFRRVGTDEFISVKLEDGTKLSGERMRRHATDPYGAIRVNTKDGIRILRPDEIQGEVRIVKEGPQKVGLRQRRLARRAARKEPEVREAVATATELEAPLEDLAREGEKYVVGPQGYLDPATYQAIREGEQRKRAMAQPSARAVGEGDNARYFIVHGKKVYKVDPRQLQRGKFQVAEIKSDDADHGLALKADREPIAIRTEDGARYLTAEDLGKPFSADQLILEQDALDIEDKDQRVAAEADNALLRGLPAQLGKSLTPKDLGLEIADDPPGEFSPGEITETAGVTFRRPAELFEDDEDPVEALPETLPPREPAGAQLPAGVVRPAPGAPLSLTPPQAVVDEEPPDEAAPLPPVDPGTAARIEKLPKLNLANPALEALVEENLNRKLAAAKEQGVAADLDLREAQLLQSIVEKRRRGLRGPVEAAAGDQ